ncbi:phosphatidate cytidylyltransferase [Heliobacterium gestii]|uniref:Phosphatidate cytidylyltransferase n=1 Tax=Heliomicrobium gestii TaxID=2699 RepID=A0A845L9W1_HELGE|nr:phosphatidate cytidylyltransferase [Heliomicrobium gestii]MBM7867144.1 phosphatidate cytidylyltransferase [Heliomicrobium gestii]MZP43442.1 phosphatidate cytidylyltransferase [Heliomicrobium gestii]
MLWKRVASALVGVPLLVAVVWAGGWAMTAAVAVLAVGGFYEYLQMVRRLETDPPAWLGYGISVALVLAAHFGGEPLPAIAAAAGLAFLFHIVMAYPKVKPADGALAFTGAFAVAWLLSHLVLLRRLPNGVEAVLLAFFLTWATDTGAYFAGRSLGKRPLAARVSPKKTMEGSLGGLIAAALVGVILGPRWFPAYSWVIWLPFSLVVSALGQLGDLAESALKRIAGVKDSGDLIPGHGGVLDRFDSILWTAPATYYFLRLFEEFLR